MRTKRTQSERRQATKFSLLAAARRLFGKHGYGETGLDDIATACDVTIRPIYHYFDNKLGLFKAVIDQIEAEMVSSIEAKNSPSIVDVWTGFMESCEDPHFRQIILIDGMALLGRRRMMDGPINRAARKRTAEILGRSPQDLSINMLMGALSSAAFYIAEHGASQQDYADIRKLIEYFIKQDKP